MSAHGTEAWHWERFPEQAASACSYKRGLDLGKDPAFQARLKDPEMYEYMYGSTATSLGKEISASAKRAVYIFLASIAVSVLINSQGAVVVAMLPLAYSLGIPGPVLLGVLPSVCKHSIKYDCQFD